MATVATYLVLFRDGKTLLLRRANTGYADGMYSMIAGHLDGGETVAHAMVREAGEEAGLVIDESDIEIVHVMHRKANDGERIDYFCTVESIATEPVNAEPQKCDDLAWFPVDDLPPNTLPYIKSALDYIQDNVRFSSEGF